MLLLMALFVTNRSIYDVGDKTLILTCFTSHENPMKIFKITNPSRHFYNDSMNIETIDHCYYLGIYFIA